MMNFEFKTCKKNNKTKKGEIDLIFSKYNFTSQI